MNLEKFPRNPGDYVATSHFNDISTEPVRHITPDRLFETIRYGRRKKARGNADAEFVRDYDGVRFYILVGHDEALDRFVLVTGWPSLYDPVRALLSGKWSDEELRAIHAFNDHQEPLEEVYEGYPPPAPVINWFAK
jgi:hypothetical protein